MLAICPELKRLHRVLPKGGKPLHYSAKRVNRVTNRNLHVAIVGSGPAGFYSADELFRSSLKDVKIDMYERLPTPYGLVRNGVAPDHPEVKSVEHVFHSLAQSPSFQFIGNVSIGQDLSIDDLKKHYEVIILAYGAEGDKRLGIPGEDLKGVHSARSFVEWYNGFPLQNTAVDAFDLSGTDAVIIGNGNVAVDVARILLRQPSELKATDISEDALSALYSSHVHRVSMVGRRGAVQAAYTTSELRELLRLEGVSKIIPDQMLVTTESDEVELQERPTKRKFDLLQKYLSSPHPRFDQRVLQFYFSKSPVEFIEDPKRPGHIGAVKFENNFLEGEPKEQKAVGSGFFSEIPAQLVLTSIGYSAKPMEGLPFDSRKGLIPNKYGKVEGHDRIYVCGWIKRGPSGIIGTNKYDAEQVIQTIVADIEQRLPEQEGFSISGSKIGGTPSEAIKAILAAKNVVPVSFKQWSTIDSEEIKRGSAKAKLREKIKNVVEMLSVARTSK